MKLSVYYMEIIIPAVKKIWGMIDVIVDEPGIQKAMIVVNMVCTPKLAKRPSSDCERV